MGTSDSWTGKGRNTGWFDRNNWSAGIPGAKDAVTFDDGGNWAVSLASAHGKIARALSMSVSGDTLTLGGGSLALGAGAVGTDLTVDNAGALTIAAGTTVTTQAGAIIGSVDQMTGMTTTGAITVAGTLAAASINDITGAMVVQAGAALDVSDTLSLTPFEDYFDQLVPATLDISASVTSGTITGLGTIALSGPGAALDCAVLQSAGDLTIAHGANAAITQMLLGDVVTSRFGAVTVDGAGSALTASVIEDGGSESNAALTVQDGGQVTAGAIDFNTYLTDDDMTIIGAGSSVDVGTLAVGYISDTASLSVTQDGTLAVGAGGLTVELCPFLLDGSAQVTTPFIDSLAGTIEALAGAGSLVTIGAPVMLGVAPDTNVGDSVFMSANGVVLEVTGAITGAAGTTLDTVGQVILTDRANTLPAIAIESGTLTLAAIGAAGKAGIDFANTGGAACILQFDPDASLHNVLSDFGAGDSIDLQGFAFSEDFMEGLGHGTLTLANGHDAVSLVFAGRYTLQDFVLTADAHGGTLIRFGG
jgi:fibronectin-binding autotransporter adhesin